MAGSGSLLAVHACQGKSYKTGWMKVRFICSAASLIAECDFSLASGDRVQWFRAEAEMRRWLEEWEIRQADYLRCIRYFQTMAQIWQGLVTICSDDNLVQLGKNAYARKKAQMYTDMANHAIELLTTEGYGHLLDDKKAFYEHIEAVRSLPENILSYRVE